ncbi:BAG family molecular chaperone regulator 2-like [Pyrus ussuriensis x Pyrus communis]|uniref:BAG family molecular chaperone regulator 2-like n=1 Tax=Pyrus ussuriensis x Pyrus communis TaxID=2448454 RepID=A0A5N5GTD2_9ROSA|nr:BAG family molecular chaperone regulator 2 [Pyrus x bretschneideri]KAB2614034.1 BAG family molecular chaperone regulator 2-like [Pyrus ussuriensis x Pyrus communis]
MIKLRSNRFCRSFSSCKLISSSSSKSKSKAADQKEFGGGNINNNSEIKWERRPGGMLVQTRETAAESSAGEGMITVRVSTVSHFRDISIEATSTFGELKMILSLVTGMEAREQRLLYKGKQREDGEYLHMVGVRDKEKVLLLQDPAIKEMKLLHGIGTPSTCRSIRV